MEKKYFIARVYSSDEWISGALALLTLDKEDIINIENAVNAAKEVGKKINYSSINVSHVGSVLLSDHQSYDDIDEFIENYEDGYCNTIELTEEKYREFEKVLLADKIRCEYSEVTVSSEGGFTVKSYTKYSGTPFEISELHINKLKS